MKMREAAALAEKLWSRGGPDAFTETIDIVQRKHTSPRFLVGFAYLDGTKAHTMRRSDVDWESACAQATGARPSDTCRSHTGLDDPCWPHAARIHVCKDAESKTGANP